MGPAELAKRSASRSRSRWRLADEAERLEGAARQTGVAQSQTPSPPGPGRRGELERVAARVPRARGLRRTSMPARRELDGLAEVGLPSMYLLK